MSVLVVVMMFSSVFVFASVSAASQDGLFSSFGKLFSDMGAAALSVTGYQVSGGGGGSAVSCPVSISVSSDKQTDYSQGETAVFTIKMYDASGSIVKRGASLSITSAAETGLKFGKSFPATDSGVITAEVPLEAATYPQSGYAVQVSSDAGDCTPVSGGQSFSVQTTPSVPDACQKLSDRITAAYLSSCGSAKYDYIADLNGDKLINAVDLSLIATHSTDAAWCSNALAAAKNPCKNETVVYPDLSITNVKTYPVTVNAGTEVTFEVIVKNIGKGATKDYSFSYEYGESGSTGVGSDMPLSIPSGGMRNETLRHKYAAAGTYTAVFSVNTLGDADSFNNKAYGKVVVSSAANVPEENVTTKCTDSDGGFNLYKKGTVTVSNGSYSQSATDYCNGGSVYEYYCRGSNNNVIGNGESGTQADGEYETCPNGCSDGACITKNLTLCTAQKITGSLSKTAFAQDEKVTLAIKASDAQGKPVAANVGFSVTQNGADVNGAIDDFHYQTPADTGTISAVRTFNYAPGNYALRFFQVDKLGGIEIKCNNLVTSPVPFTVLPKSAACTDSDRGKDYYTQGYSKGKPNPVNDWTSGALSADTYDICAGGKLYEYYCDDTTGYLNREIIACKTDCADGACLKEPRASVVCQKLLDTVKASYGKGCGDAGYDPVADVNRDQKVNALDLSLLRLNLNNSLWCQAVFASPQPTCVEEVPAGAGAEAFLNVGGKTYKVVNASDASQSDFPVLVDYNADAAMNAHLPIAGRESGAISKNTYFYLWGYGVMQYLGADSYTNPSRMMRFRDAKTGSVLEVDYIVEVNASFTATLQLGEKSYGVSASDVSSSDFAIKVDMDGSGVIGDRNANIVNNELVPVQKNDYVYLVGYGDLVRYTGADPSSNPSHAMRFQDVSTGNMMEVDYTVTGGTQCSDSDGGVNYYTKGTVTGAWPGHSNIETETDSCVQSLATVNSSTQPPITTNSSDTLAEVFCQDSRIAVSYKVCENGCSDGACQKEAPPSFPDKFSGAVKLSPGWNLLGAFLLDGSRTTYTFNDCDDSGNVLAAYYYDQDTDRYVDLLTTSTEKQQPVEEEKAQPSAVQERKQVEDQTPPSSAGGSGGGGGGGGTGTVVVGTLDEGQVATYTLYGKQYEIWAEYVGSQTARLSVNGELTTALQEGQSYTLFDGSVIRIIEIKAQEIAGGVRQVKFSFQKDASYASKEVINSFWLKVARPCKLKFELDEPYQWISAVNREGKQLAKGWNLLAVVPDMVGLTTDEFSGTCNMQKAYGWDPESKSWENLKYGSLEKKAVGYGFAAKVDNDCMLEQPALPQTATAQAAADQPPKLPND